MSGDVDVATDPGFGEVRRPHVWSGNDDYRAPARAYVDGVHDRDHAGGDQHARPQPVQVEPGAAQQSQPDHLVHQQGQ